MPVCRGKKRGVHKTACAAVRTGAGCPDRQAKPCPRAQWHHLASAKVVCCRVSTALAGAAASRYRGTLFLHVAKGEVPHPQCLNTCITPNHVPPLTRFGLEPPNGRVMGWGRGCKKRAIAPTDGAPARAPGCKLKTTSTCSASGSTNPQLKPTEDAAARPWGEGAPGPFCQQKAPRLAAAAAAPTRGTAPGPPFLGSSRLAPSRAA